MACAKSRHAHQISGEGSNSSNRNYALRLQKRPIFLTPSSTVPNSRFESSQISSLSPMQSKPTDISNTPTLPNASDFDGESAMEECLVGALVYRLLNPLSFAVGQWLFFKARATSISRSICKERATRKNSQLDTAQRVAMKMGRRRRCSSVTYRFRYAPSSRLADGPF